MKLVIHKDGKIAGVSDVESDNAEYLACIQVGDHEKTIMPNDFTGSPGDDFIAPVIAQPDEQVVTDKKTGFVDKILAVFS
jgi:hypothetical protein